MPKTKEFTINCSNIRIKPTYSHKHIEVTIEEPDVDAIFQQFKEEDITEYVERNIKPEDCYSEDTLADWAERNGYTKTQE